MEALWIAVMVVWAYFAGMVVGAAHAEAIQAAVRRLLRPLRCRLHLCGGRVTQTEHGIGWQCATCGKLAHWESWATIERHKRERQDDA